MIEQGKKFQQKVPQQLCFRSAWLEAFPWIPLHMCEDARPRSAQRKTNTVTRGIFNWVYSGIAKEMQWFFFARLCNLPRNLVPKLQPITVVFQRLRLVMGIYFLLSPCDIPLQLLIERCNYQGFGSLFQVVENHF